MQPSRLGRHSLLAALVLAAAVPAMRAHAQPAAACCLPGNDCQHFTPDACASRGGLYMGQLLECSDVPDCRVGACCKRATPSTPQGTCDGAETEAECARECGVWFSLTGCEVFQSASCASVFVNKPPLAGDCNRDGAVQVNELVKSVNIALCGDDFSGQPCCYWISRQGVPPYEVCYPPAHLAECPAIDTNRSGRVEVFELVQAVNAALGPYCYQ